MSAPTAAFAREAARIQIIHRAERQGFIIRNILLFGEYFSSHEQVLQVTFFVMPNKTFPVAKTDARKPTFSR
jgi:hypothetical protein